MALSSAGIGSGLDVAGIVAKLVAAERAPSAQRLQTQESKVTSQISAMGTFRSALSSLQTAAEALKVGGDLSKLAATSSKPELFTASTAQGANPGSFNIEVVSLAQAHKVASGAFASGSSALGAGDVEIAVGDKSFTVSLGSSKNTLADLRDAINKSGDNPGVTATLINESGGTRLMLTSSQAGTESQITVNSSLLSFSENQAASDAHVRIDGFDVFSQSNTIDKAIDGVSINLLKAEAGTTATLNVDADKKAMTTAIEGFVKAYNSVVSTMDSITRYDAGSNTAQPLAGDAMVRGIGQTLQSIVGNVADSGGAFKMLSQIGIDLQTNGQLKIDNDKLSQALSDDRANVEKLFAGNDGYALRLADTVADMLGSQGQIKAKDDALQSQKTSISRDQERLDERMSRVEARYQAQFSALDTLMAQMTSTSNFLSQQLAGLAQMM